MTILLKRGRKAVNLVSITLTALWSIAALSADGGSEPKNESDERAVAHAANELKDYIDQSTSAAGDTNCGGPQAPVGTLLNSAQLSQLPVGTKFQITQDLNLKSSAGKPLNEKNTTLFMLKGSVVGSSQFFVDPASLGFAVTRDELKAEIGKAVGKASPDSGMYCFINTKGLGSLAVKGNAVSLPAGQYTMKGCTDKEAVSSTDGLSTTNFSFNLFGHTNKTTLTTCFMTADSSDPDPQLYTLGCVAYRSDKVANTDDFLGAIGGSSVNVRFADPRSPEQIAADKAKATEAKRIAEQKAAAKAAEDAKREAEHNAIADRYEASRAWSDEVLRKMPKYNDPSYLKLVKDQPEVGTLRDACMNDYITGTLKFSAMPQSCVDFFKVLKK